MLIRTIQNNYYVDEENIVLACLCLHSNSSLLESTHLCANESNLNVATRQDQINNPYSNDKQKLKR